MRAIIIEDKDGQALLDKLELTKMKAEGLAPNVAKANIDIIHKKFRFEVVQWLNLHGWEL